MVYSGNEDAWLAGIIFDLIFYIIFILSIYSYGKYNSFSKNKYIYSYIFLFISFFVFPVILQIATYIYIIIKENRVIEKINTSKLIIENKINQKNKIFENIKYKTFSFVYVVFILFMTFSYFFGGYKLFTDKNYSTKHFIAGIVFPPYTIYVGVKETFKENKTEYSNTNKELNDFNKWIKNKTNF